MRLVLVKNLKGGERIGMDILTPDGGILLKASTTFRTVFKQKLIDRNIYEVFIEDDLSEGIIPPSLINPILKNKLTNHLKLQFESLEKLLAFNLDDIQEMASTILNAIQSSDLILDLEDLKRNDNYTYSHCLNVSILSCALAKKLGFTFEMIEKIVIGAILHDIGKMIIPKNVLNKRGKLDPDERVIMESHSKLGYDFIKNNNELSPISKVIILCHHEREDGTGYPLKKGADLHIASKLVAVVDVFDALISDRPYRNGFPVNTALSILKQEKLNLDIVGSLENMIAFYPVGSCVMLNNHHIGLVELNFADDLSRPLVRVIYDSKTKTPLRHKCNLKLEPTFSIIAKIDDLSQYIPFV